MVAMKHAWVPVSAPPCGGFKVTVAGVLWSTTSSPPSSVPSQLLGPAACALAGTASATATSANVVTRCATCIARNPHPRALESQLDGRLGPSTVRLVRIADIWSCTSMAHRAFLTTTLLAVGLALPSVAIAAPPANDNYLGSTTIVNADGSLP